MSGLIERVARALHHAEASTHASETKYGDLWGWDDLMPAVRERHIAAARAAVEAMREPSEEMVEEALCGAEADPRWMDRGPQDAFSRAYRAMIDAALNASPAPAEATAEPPLSAPDAGAGDETNK